MYLDMQLFASMSIGEISPCHVFNHLAVHLTIALLAISSVDLIDLTEPTMIYSAVPWTWANGLNPKP